MGSNAHKGVGTRSGTTKPDLWYYDRLPPTARAALANAEHDWSAGWIYTAWNRAKPGYRTGQQCADRVRDADRRNRTNLR